ncbi:thiol reductant ABC exporter subunit CydC [Devosia neptuniae]|jgi:ATP-binding cassette subfamily C protein CydC|uniref:thiol reductant ABC exporter subunit CydC n=1 Tax=Devosia TaxID=46913 RepID=UPI0022AF8AF2|nr:thiol reductant ABC exporter subunit CydC [Devosia neptuniae]MCZ4344790.1 thiol reductant ABC exporter subunit CydC [Devosia neptuniae]|tara:strand:+ start:7205 stop:8857 length:1653 start_codon:yes stop_codon:yes gene_type:complete
MNALLAFRGLFARQAKGLLIALLLSLVALASGVALLGTSGWFITATALTSAGLAFNLFVPSAMVRGFSFVRILARYGERLSGHDATLRLLADIRGWLFGRLFPRLPLNDRHMRHGDLVSRLTADVDALDTAFLVAIGPITAAVVIGTVLTSVLAFLLPAAAVVYGLSFGMAVLLVPAGLVLTSRKAGSAIVMRAAAARAAVLDGIEGHADLTLFGALGDTQARFSETATALSEARGRLATLSGFAAFGVQALAAIALAGSLWLGLEAFAAEQIDGPVLVGLLLAILGSFEASSVIVRSVTKLTTAMAAAERLTAIADAPIKIVDPANPIGLPDNLVITLDKVRFAYDGGAPVLNDLELSVAPGEHVAIVGPSGIGKSSLLSLLLRLAEPQSGSITLGGVDLSALALRDLQTSLALLSQDSPLFNDTISANLLIARPDASEDALWGALDAAGIGDFVRALPKRLDTLVGEAGRTVSAGQGRRLCLARTLLSPAPILLLDEPTTGLDRTAEVAFFDTLRKAATGRTVILVTHAGIPEGTVDRVLTMRGGQLT